MEFRQILYFIEVAKREHVTKTAEALHVAQSAISRQISLLEAELGVSLFTREGRNVKLTHMGRLFLKHAERGLKEFDKAKQKIQEHLNPEIGKIHLGLSTSLAIHTLPIVLSQFNMDHPTIQFQLHQGTLSYLTQLIENDGIDIAFASPLPKEHSLVDSHVLFKEKMVAVLHSEHHLANQTSILLNQLAEERFITFRRGMALQELFRDACQQAGFNPSISFEGEDMDTIKQLVSAGFGVAILPENTVTYNLPPDVVTVSLEDPKVVRTVGLLMPKSRELAPSEQLFFNFVIEFYERFT
ncbi:LysR family transcriptional regulator [Terrilactibacillus sp. BCM23-1]|uniref:LysR family transcriptional regulator n=1 Tax=Terrilactibacillus tamarindi TaxID=2599694 RepID=A0A6N8CPD7_9BACI|nr:LysR family transcriptional regulator [Terrilactibacillus tamarindi]MTT30745.1 LysR family transcriptional regulator [Terrilactibacillus tamarindi]